MFFSPISGTTELDIFSFFFSFRWFSSCLYFIKVTFVFASTAVLYCFDFIICFKVFELKKVRVIVSVGSWICVSASMRIPFSFSILWSSYETSLALSSSKLCLLETLRGDLLLDLLSNFIFLATDDIRNALLTYGLTKSSSDEISIFH